MGLASLIASKISVRDAARFNGFFIVPKYCYLEQQRL